jgi:hypothetical protein
LMASKKAIVAITELPRSRQGVALTPRADDRRKRQRLLTAERLPSLALHTNAACRW